MIGKYIAEMWRWSKLLSQKSRVISCNLEVDDHYLDPTFLYYRPEGTRFHSSVGSKQVRSMIQKKPKIDQQSTPMQKFEWW